MFTKTLLIPFTLFVSSGFGRQNNSAAAAQPAYSFSTIFTAGKTIGGHTFTPDTAIDSVALSNNGRCIFLARWHEAEKGDQAAIFGRNRVVVKQGDIVDGKFIAFFPKNARIAVNDNGSVAYEAYSAASHQDADLAFSYDSVFVEDHQVLSTQSTGGDKIPDFTLNEEGIIQVEEFNPSTSQETEAKPSRKATNKKGIFDNIHVIPPKLLKGFAIPSLPATKKSIAKLPKPTSGLKQPSETHTSSCPLPDFPLPSQWSPSAGIAFHIVEPPVRGRIFNARIPYMSGPYTDTFRVIHFGPTCLPKLIVLGEASLVDSGGVIAVYSAHGLVTNIDPDGYLAFDGPSIHIQTKTDAFTRIDGPLAINAQDDILVSVKSGHETTLLLGSPVNQ